VNNIRSTLAIVWRIAAPYFRSEDKWTGRILLAAVIVIQLLQVAIDVLINQWNNRFYNALQNRDWDSFMREVGIFTILAFASIGLAVYQLYLNQWLQIRWRGWLTNRYLGEWLHDANHYRMQLQGDAADNPDQRVSDDLKSFVDRTLDIGLSVLGSVVTVASFVVILWQMSNEAPMHFLGRDFPIPGYLVWAALIYAFFGTALTQWIGAPLVHLAFQQERLEADFRFNLVRVRENSEQIALLRGENAEREHLLTRFGRVAGNWFDIMNRTKRLTAFTQSYGQAALIFPTVLLAPAYFADRIQLGGMMQAADAFESVRKALSVFVTIYRTLAEWRAIVARLDGFEMAIQGAAKRKSEQPSIEVGAAAEGDAIGLADVLVRLPDGTQLLSANGFNFSGHEHTLLSGPSGAGKSTLFRSVAGIWPYGSGSISIPAHATLMLLPQRPYFPIGPLKDAIVYPSEPDAFASEQVNEALAAVGLPRLVGRLEEEAHWNRMLSLGEQQRLALTRALLHAPQFLFLDEATASLDEPSEAALYRLLREKLPGTTIVSIGHRSTLQAFHERHLVLGPAPPGGEGFTLQERKGARLPAPQDITTSAAAKAPASAGGVASGARNKQTE
jgi:vitamin B12/bleomycin/antimicrobial peptide transport system ATP-binding/permease protein